MRPALLPIFALASLFAGCSANLADGRFTCGPGIDCPPGFACHADGRCYRGASGADAAVADGAIVDAAIIDAGGPGAVGAECGSDMDCATGLSCYADESMVLRCHCEPYANVGCGSGQACYFYVYLNGPPVVLEARCRSIGAAPTGDTACTVDFDDSSCAPSHTCASASAGCQPLCRGGACDAGGCQRFSPTTTPTGYGWCGPP